VNTLTRRGVLGLAATAAGCAARKSQRSGVPSAPSITLAPVNVDRQRVIRTVAGLRPYRPSGFVVKTEALGRKTIVHN